MHDIIKKFLRANKQNIISLTQDLIRIQSVNGNETSVAKHLSEILSKEGIKCRLLGNERDRKSLVAQVGHGNKQIMLNGHLDTVAAGEIADWRYPPFSGQLSAGRIYGRGACDMKGALAAATYAALAIKQIANRLPGTLVLAFNADEESGKHTGIRDLLKRGITADAAICCEPMLDKTLIIGAKGIYRFELETIGTSGHTGYPIGRINAVTKMAKLLLSLEKMKFSWTKHPLFTPPFVVPGTVIEGGLAINIFPERCRALVDCRLSYGQTIEKAKFEIASCLKKAKESDPEIKYNIREIGFVYPALTSGTHPFVKLSKRVISETQGFFPKIGIIQGVTDGNFLMNQNIPTVIYGPTGSNFHAPNEFVNVSSLLKTAETYAMHVVGFCDESS